MVVLSSCIYKEIKFGLPKSLRLETIQIKRVGSWQVTKMERPDWDMRREEGYSLYLIQKKFIVKNMKICVKSNEGGIQAFCMLLFCSLFPNYYILLTMYYTLAYSL